MGAAYFYHLTRRPLEATLPLLLSKSLAAGWRVQVVGGDPARLEALDARLWLGDEANFLPHGLAGGAHDAEQPILLTPLRKPDLQAACVMCIDGAEISAEDVSALERACILFDGNNEAELNAARLQWKRLTDAGCAAQYWSEESGNWQKKAEKSA